ncbi:FusB/FusC family EF-G-binding protein [Bacillus sp. 1P06AnD]|uniref:FusB/FusC family EF-G-binding protein n=1 Tax=Bacillus sp. 1P06AnD TaxID=3132208 RepID=UPI0039A2A6F5
MIPFITNDQYNFIMKQAKLIDGARHTVNDGQVKKAFIYSAFDKVLELFPHLEEEQHSLLSDMLSIESESGLEQFERKIGELCIPFPALTDHQISKLFRKVKKLNNPALTEDQWNHLTFVSWNDKGNGRKFIIKEVDGKLVGIHGRFLLSSKKGICHFCHHHSQVGLFTVELKSKGASMNYKALGNYICEDGEQCNRQILSTERIDSFLRETSK